MSVRGNLIRAFGRGVKVYSGTFSITGNGTVTVPATIVTAVATVSNATTALPTDTASITSGDGTSTLAIVVVQHAATANSIETVAKNVDVIAIVQ